MSEIFLERFLSLASSFVLHYALIILFSFGNASTKFSRVVSSVSNFRAQKNHLQRNVDFRQMLLQIPWRFLFTYTVSWLFVTMDTVSVNSLFFPENYLHAMPYFRGRWLSIIKTNICFTEVSNPVYVPLPL